jgi:protein TonB
MNLMRYPIAVVVGAAVSFALLFLMQQMIATGRGVWTDDTQVALVDFVRVEPRTVEPPEREKPERPEEPEEMPDPVVPDRLDDFGTTIPVSIGRPTAGTGGRRPGIGVWRSDGEYLPIVTVAPVYPPRPLKMNLEGYVIVEFTVTAAGSTRDARVVESSSALFERAAIESALKYRYKPRVINGEPVEVPGVRTRIRFLIED